MEVKRKRKGGYGMEPIRLFVPYGAVGLGIAEEAFAEGMKMKPDIICCDAGSTDSGPYYLGTGHGKYMTGALKRDLRRMVVGADQLGIPMVIGSAGTCGSDEGVDLNVRLIREICAEEGIRNKKIVKIYSEQDAQVLRKKYRSGKVHALTGAPDITEDTFDACTHIVALAGAEPFQKALEMGADIIVCGRSTDTAIMSFYPLLKGADPASCWHAAKIAECGGLCTTAGLQGGAFLELDDKGFTVKAVAPGATVSPYSVSAHLLYENSDPVHLTEPGIQIDTTHTTYTAVDSRSVRVEGTVLTKRPYTMKLEGSGPVGYQTLSLVGIRDRAVLRELPRFLKEITENGVDKLTKMGVDRKDYDFNLKPYGYNAVSGLPVKNGYIPEEIGLLLTVTARDQALATQVAKSFNPLLLHYNMFPGKQMPSFGFAFSPAEIERGKIYEFKLFHVVDVDDPLELVQFVQEEI